MSEVDWLPLPVNFFLLLAFAAQLDEQYELRLFLKDKILGHCLQWLGDSKYINLILTSINDESEWRFCDV